MSILLLFKKLLCYLNSFDDESLALMQIWKDSCRIILILLELFRPSLSLIYIRFQSLPLVKFKLVFFFIFVSLMAYLSRIFMIDVFIFTTTDWLTDDEKEGKINSLSNFEGLYLNSKQKMWKFINIIDSW